MAYKLRSRIKVPAEIDSLVPYPPGKPIEELERELGIKGSIKLASNENPLGPSPLAVKAVEAALAGLHRYPDGSSHYLKEKLSARLGVPGDMLTFGNGSNEIIELLIRTYLGRGAEAVMGEPSFAVYPLVVQAAGGVARRVPLKGFTHDLDAMAEGITEATRLIFIANPNNPTGTIVSGAAFERFLKRVPDGVIVCMDEAYIEYVRSPEFPDSLKYVREGWPVVVLRTFSKIYGLAGLRIGYGVAHPEITDYINRVRQPFNVNSLAQVAALAALDDAGHLDNSVANNTKGLEYLLNAMDELGYECVPTEANFLLIKVGDGKGVYERLLKKGVIVRPMASYGLDKYIRVTVGLPDELRRFVDELSAVKSG